MHVNEAITLRRSTRSFLPKLVERKVLDDILRYASQAPSSGNVQPWKVYVLQGEAKDRLTKKVCEANTLLNAKTSNAQSPMPNILRGNSINANPTEWVEPYLGRKRANGKELYNLLQIPKHDTLGMQRAQERNYKFFDAPVGMFFTINVTAPESWLIDYGMFLQTLALAAAEQGLSTCFQGAWTRFGKIVLREIEAPPDEKLLCGVSIGYADLDNKINTLAPARESVESFTTWLE